mmetsp:Transcript_51310/g.160219  ORF Transcript_51310/g.160219 Transcript_51310/m.160219 type:complete len:200 (-) Transcript_51310:703-1302(-)
MKLIRQDKKKFENKKKRIIIRFSKRNLSLQMVNSNVDGDFILLSSYLKNLSKLEYKNLTNNYPFSYLLGYYFGKDLIEKVKQSETYNKKNYSSKITAIIDIGLKRATIGNKSFASMKGSVDSGINIPHNYNKIFKVKNNEIDSKELFNERSKGIHIIKYIDLLKNEDEEKLKKQFSNIFLSRDSLSTIKKNYLIKNKNK